MKIEYLFAPQWQDSGITNELYLGSVALYEYCKNRFTNEITRVQIDNDEKPIIENNILGYSLIYNQLSAIKNTLENSKPDKIISIGGGCGIEVPIVSYLAGLYPDLKLFWFDAHGDLNSPETSPSKHYHGMPLRFLTEKQDNTISKNFRIIETSSITLIGTRDLDDPEKQYIKRNGIVTIKCGNRFLNEIDNETKNCHPAYIHIDLDVIDPKYYKNVKCPVMQGISISELESGIKMIKEKMNVVGISILENLEIDQQKISVLDDIIGLMEYK